MGPYDRAKPTELDVPSIHQVPTTPCPTCYACGSQGVVAYSGLEDRIFDVKGQWRLLRCSRRRCGLLWLDPMPAKDYLPRLYETYYTHRQREKALARARQMIQNAYWSSRYGYESQGRLSALIIPPILGLFPGIRRELDQQVFELPAKARGQLLDVGCGSGGGLARMAALGWEVEGVDFDPEAAQQAVSNGLKVRVGSLEQQNYPSGSFDAVVMNHVLEHVPDPRALLQECHRVLRPGGRLVCITPNASAWCHTLFKEDWRGLEPPRHLHIFTQDALHMIARHSDWTSVEVRSTMASAHYMVWASSKLKLYDRYSATSQPGVFGEIASRAFQIAAMLKHAYAPEVGEELVLKAVR